MQIRETNLLSPQLPETHETKGNVDLKRIIAQSQFGLRLSNGLSFSSGETTCQEKHIDNRTFVTSEGSLLRPEMTLIVERQNTDCYTFTMQITNTTPNPLLLEDIMLFQAPQDLFSKETEIMQTGWQSWSMATHQTPLAHLPKEKHTPASLKGPKLSLQDFPWITIISQNDTNLLIGFTSAEHAVGMIHESHQENPTFDATYHLAGKVLAPQQTFTTETLMLAKNISKDTLLAKYATAVAETSGVTKRVSPPTGWTSWYEYFDTVPVTPEEIKKQLDVLQADNIPAEIIQIDDGYQTSWGDWQPQDDKFPQGLKPVVDTIHQAGRKAGIWWSPFLVGANSQLVANHPEWLVKEKNTLQPLLAREMTFKSSPKPISMYCLDPTHPEVLNFLRQTTRQFVKEYGFDYLKLDFLYAGLLDGKRYNPNLSTTEAYRSALSVIRQEAEDTFLVGCGAPLLPSVGLVDAMRISSDTEFIWEDAPNQWKDRPGLHNVVRSIFAHWWMHNTLWINDPDVITLRDHDTSLSEDERLMLTTIILLSGGSRFLGDNLSLLEEDKKRMLTSLLRFPFVTGIPIGPYTDGFPQKIVAQVNPTTHVIALFNWENQTQTFLPNPSIFQHHKLFDIWENKPITANLQPMTIPSHGVKFIEVTQK